MPVEEKEYSVREVPLFTTTRTEDEFVKMAVDYLFPHASSRERIRAMATLDRFYYTAKMACQCQLLKAPLPDFPQWTNDAS